MSPPASEGPTFAEITGDRFPLARGVWRWPPLPVPALIEIHIVAAVRGDSGGAVVQRGEQVGAKPRALGAGEQRSRKRLRDARG